MLRPLGEFQFISRSLNGHTEVGKVGNRFTGTWLASVPSPLPADFLLGLDVQRFEFEKKKWSYLRGEQRFGGWWWYYLYALGVKTPLGTLALFATACLTIGRRRGSASRGDELVVLLPARGVAVGQLTDRLQPLSAVCAADAAGAVHLDQPHCSGHDPVRGRQPPDSADATDQLSAASMARSLTASQQLGRRLQLVLAVLCVCATAVSSLRVFPHSMTYFHELVGGPTGGIGISSMPTSTGARSY